MAHLEIGRLAMAAGDYASAAAHFEEASYAAYYFTDVNHVPDLNVMEEAFRLGPEHLLANGKVIFPPLALATAWAKTTHSRQLYVSLLILAAENQLVLGQTPGHGPAGRGPHLAWQSAMFAAGLPHGGCC